MQKVRTGLYILRPHKPWQLVSPGYCNKIKNYEHQTILYNKDIPIEITYEPELKQAKHGRKEGRKCKVCYLFQCQTHTN
jgi:hypothetical protein